MAKFNRTNPVTGQIASESEAMKPEDMAATALWLARQPRSAWTFEADVRPFGEKW